MIDRFRFVAAICALLVLASCGGSVGPAPPPPSPVYGAVLPVNDLLYHPALRVLIASIPGAAGPGGNSIWLIEPEKLEVTAVIAVGSEPNKLALSDDGTILYVGLDGAAAIRVVNMATRTAGSLISLGNDPIFGPLFPEDIGVQPGTTNTIAVTRKFLNVSPRHAGVAIYEGDVMRPTTTHRDQDPYNNVIEFSESPGALYCYNNEITGQEFNTLTVDASGVRVTGSNAHLVTGFSDIEFDRGNRLVYATSGRVVDPAAGRLVGTVDARGPVEPDSARDRVFFVTGGGSEVTVMAYSATSLAAVGGMGIGGLSGLPWSLVRWGARGLAFNTRGRPEDSLLVLINPAPGLDGSSAHLRATVQRVALRRGR
jgi:hypothetical protein